MYRIRLYARMGLLAGVLVCLIGDPAQVRAAETPVFSLDDIYQALAGYYLPEGVQKHLGVVIGVWAKQITISQSRYGWDWLAARNDPNKDGRIARTEFLGSEEMFQRLDRNRDGALTREDFDWSDRSPLVRQAQQANRFMQEFDKDSNGRISPEEWKAIFAEATKSKGYLDPQDLQDLFYPQPAAYSRSSLYWTLLGAMLRGDLGTTFADAPRPGRSAPDFNLKTQDGGKEVRLSQFRGKRPVVLVFGSFT